MPIRLTTAATAPSSPLTRAIWRPRSRSSSLSAPTTAPRIAMSSEVASSWAPCSTSLMPAAATTSPSAATRSATTSSSVPRVRSLAPWVTDARPAAAASAAAATTSIPATTRSVPSMASASAALRASAAVCLVVDFDGDFAAALVVALAGAFVALGAAFARRLRAARAVAFELAAVVVLAGRLPLAAVFAGMDVSSLSPHRDLRRRASRGIGRLAPSCRRHSLTSRSAPACRDCPLVGSCRLLLFGVRRDPGRGIVEPQTDTPVEVANRRAVGRRRVLSGVALVLACLTILLATVAVWVHQVAFNTDRFTGLVANVIDEPDVIDSARAPRSASRSSRRSTSRPGSRAGCRTWRSRWHRPSRSPSRMGSPAACRSAWPGRRSRQLLLKTVVDRAHPGHEPASRQLGRGERGGRLRDHRGVAAGPGRALRAAVGRTAARRGPDPRPDDVGGSRRPRPAAVHGARGHAAGRLRHDPSDACRPAPRGSDGRARIRHHRGAAHRAELRPRRAGDLARARPATHDRLPRARHAHRLPRRAARDRRLHRRHHLGDRRTRAWPWASARSSRRPSTTCAA